MDANISSPSMVPAGAVVAAVIAGGLALTNLVTAKEQKVSEFRQAWIDALRASISEYLAALSYLSLLRKHWSDKGHSKEAISAHTKKIEDGYLRVHTAYNDIMLRVNPTERDNIGKILNDNFLAALQISMEFRDKGDYDDTLAACDQLRDAGKPLLKYEWQRVKRGEPAYIYAQVAALLLLLVGIAVAAWLLLAYWSNTGKNAMG